MKNENFIVINGQKYDSVTGKPLGAILPKKPAQLVDSISKKSQAVYRTAIKRPIQKSLSRRPGRNMDIARSQATVNLKTKKPTSRVSTKTSIPEVHPMVTIGEKRQSLIRNHLANQNRQLEPKTPQVVKQEAIDTALSQPSIKHKEKPFYTRHSKAIIIGTALILAVVGIYYTYTAIPSFSVKIASAQAGISASFPSYYPDGYSPNGPVTSNNSQVSINFKSNSDSSKFSIRQTRSSWDSTAVKEMVTKKSNSTFSTTEERGLTIFIYNGNAAWVNGGILYEIVGDAPLSSYQVRKIATSL